ncbi:ABC transporter permease [Lachnoclostridium sp. An181]|uniref:ABC transporter permease n=1 Tax=Lachnoclostridium sp. An181 TaxID=1965575 RepID=UPI000B3AB9EE|nr:ABC transporter permease [Lachnoclostridium sp. An181]OUP49140.1 ABC transporter [Lachnoclostridium sp. An181]
MNGVKEIFNKEMARIFKDKKMIFSVFFLPVIIMVGILGIINSLSQNMADDIEEHTSIVYMMNEPESFQAFLEASQTKCDVKNVEDMDDAKEEIKNGTADLIIEFPENFEMEVSDYKEGDTVPQIKTYYNPSEEYSSSAFQEISGGILELYRQSLLSERVGSLDNIAVFHVNSDNPDMVIQDDAKAGGKALGMMLPYLITILLFAGAMGIGTDMIAGEKERGTMASLLVTPVRRSSIVLGKVFALMVISGISSVIYLGAMIAAMPMMSGGETLNIQLSPKQGVMLGALLVSLAFLYSAIIVLLSVFAKTIKEANTYVTPAYMVILVVGLLTMFSTKGADLTSYCVPVYNSSLAMKEILTQEIAMSEYGITLGMTIVLGVLLCGVIVKAFESEKVMSL